jgi:protein-L-isoaspartate(D-aspartate) O-methyltransferase
MPEADRIYVNAGSTQPSRSWLDALHPGSGRLLFPLQPLGKLGGMLLVERPSVGTTWPARFVCRAAFIAREDTPQVEPMGQRLADAFSKGEAEAVHSLRRKGTPGATCWYAGDGWWLSTAIA